MIIEAELVPDGSWRRWRGMRAGVLIDLLRADALADPLLALRFQRLACLLPRLAHAHLQPCLEAGLDDDGGRWLVVAMPRGPTLEERLAVGGALPPAVAVGLVRTLADALEGLHRRGIVHRGVAPARVVLERLAAPMPGDPFPFAPRLGGLGLAEDPGEESGDDPRLDVRALGALLCHCLLGRPGGVAELAPAGVPADVVTLAGELVQPDTERPVDGSGVRAACDGVLSGPAGMHRAAAWIAVGAALAAALAALVWSRVG